MLGRMHYVSLVKMRVMYVGLISIRSILIIHYSKFGKDKLFLFAGYHQDCIKDM